MPTPLALSDVMLVVNVPQMWFKGLKSIFFPIKCKELAHSTTLISWHQALSLCKTSLCMIIYKSNCWGNTICIDKKYRVIFCKILASKKISFAFFSQRKEVWVMMRRGKDYWIFSLKQWAASKQQPFYLIINKLILSGKDNSLKKCIYEMQCIESYEL